MIEYVVVKLRKIFTCAILGLLPLDLYNIDMHMPIIDWIEIITITYVLHIGLSVLCSKIYLPYA